MPGFNLVRNAKVYFTNNVDATTGAVLASGFTNTNTYELQVMNGFSMSQNTEAQTITVSEAGLDPARGQRNFNTALAPADFSFTTYIRPRNNSGITCEERVLWNALFAPEPIDATGAAVTTTNISRAASAASVTFTFGSANTLGGLKVGDIITVKGVVDTVDAKQWNAPAKITAASAYAADGVTVASTGVTTLTVSYLQAPAGVATAPTTIAGGVTFHKGAVVPQNGYLLAHSGRSNKNSLTKFGLIVNFDDQTYVIDNASLNQASIDFGLDGIAQIAWSGNGTSLRLLGSYAVFAAAGGAISGGLTGTGYVAADTNAQFITNKLTTVTLNSKLRGLGGTAYTLAITGGNLTINNNINYVTPEIMGTVNQPIGYFTGTRAISGNLTAYLKTGSGKTSELMGNILNEVKQPGGSETKYSLGMQIGGATNATRVEIDLPGVMLQVPTIETQDVVSTTINFTAEGFESITSAAGGGTANYDLEATNDITVRYYSA
jgi:hypothetical protein